MTGEPSVVSESKPIDHVIEGRDSQSPALIVKDGVVTYGELGTAVSLLAGWLKAQVPEQGARVAGWAAKGKLTAIMPLAAARAGLVHIPINPLLKKDQVAHILSDSGASLIIGTPSRMSSLTSHDVPPNCALWDEPSALAEAEELNAAMAPSAASPDSLAAILYTSGSTGKPKGVMLSHANLWLGAQSVASYLQLQHDDVTLAVLPFSFDYGQNQLFSTWYAGGCVVPLEYLFAKDVVKACARFQVTTLAGVPPLWVQLSETAWPPEAAAHLRRVTNSGGALTADLIAAMRRLFADARIFAMYGLTEAFRSTFLDPDAIAIHPSSIGTAIPHAEILVVNDEGELAQDNEEGELVHCGPLVAQGYWQDDARTQERFRPAPRFSRYGGVAVWSGDRVKRDDKGLLYFIGRRDEMIKSSGNRISPQEIEEAALATGLVAEAAAFGIADPRLGQSIHLAVRAAPNITLTHGTLPALQKALAQCLPNFMQPHAIHWKDHMPINPNGKIDRTRLKQEHGL